MDALPCTAALEYYYSPMRSVGGINNLPALAPEHKMSESQVLVTQPQETFGCGSLTYRKSDGMFIASDNTEHKEVEGAIQAQRQLRISKRCVSRSA